MLESIERKETFPLDIKSLAVLNYLLLHGIVELESEESPGDPPPQQQTKPNLRFEPTNLILCPTTDCNLRCTYCYASGGASPKYMDFEMAARAIDFIVDNAVKNGGEMIRVNFHGGGEPTLAFDFIKKVCAYANELATKHKLNLNLEIGTNLVMDREKLDFLINNFHSFTVSIDGPKEIHDRNRPTAGGKGS